ncbi:hypothetical protein TNCV_3857631 [Trichonephila clavipes]|nr:hypothetical protein TNCV_3857631 [Trichonephila clavipes]
MFQILLWSPWKYRCGQRTVRMAVVACSQSQAVFTRRRSKPKLKLLDIRAEKERSREKERERGNTKDSAGMASNTSASPTGILLAGGAFPTTLIERQSPNAMAWHSRRRSPSDQSALSPRVSEWVGSSLQLTSFDLATVKNGFFGNRHPSGAGYGVIWIKIPVFDLSDVPT